MHVSAKNGQGGAGVAGLNVDLKGFGDWSPAMRLAVTEQNKAGTLSLILNDADGTSHKYTFDLRKLKPGLPAQLVPDYGASLAEPEIVEKPGTTPGLDGVAVWMIVGDWSGNALDVVLSGIGLVPPTGELRAGRDKLRELHAKEAQRIRLDAEAKEKAHRDLLAKGAEHPKDGPEVKLVCATGSDVLSVVLQAGKHASNELIPYEAKPGDEIVAEGTDQPRHAVKDGKVVDYFQKALYRTVNNNRTKVGLLSPDGKRVFIEHGSTGQLLEETVVDLPAAYSIQSPDDPAYAAPTRPAAAFRKGKPDGFSQPLPFLYTISLRLPSPLQEGATYSIRFAGVNTSRETVAYVHKPARRRSIAVHAIQTGYRPDDPYKRAYLSFWMGVDKDGKSGSCTHQLDAFELLDAAGKTVFTGKAELAKADGARSRSASMRSWTTPRRRYIGLISVPSLRRAPTACLFPASV